MRVEERDEIVQYIIRIREKIKAFEMESVNLRGEMAKMEMKISEGVNELEMKKKDILDTIDNYKVILINMPVEEPKIIKKRWWQR